MPKNSEACRPDVPTPLPSPGMRIYPSAQQHKEDAMKKPIRRRARHAHLPWRRCRRRADVLSSSPSTGSSITPRPCRPSPDRRSICSCARRSPPICSSKGSGKPFERKVVLMVHGGFSPATLAFDVPYRDYSWMERLAREGFDVFAMDMTGYGRSGRPMMDEPCNLIARPPEGAGAERRSPRPARRNIPTSSSTATARPPTSTRSSTSSAGCAASTRCR